MNRNFRTAFARRAYQTRDQISRDDVHAIVVDYFCDDVRDALTDLGFITQQDLSCTLGDYVPGDSLYDCIADHLAANLDDLLEDRGYLNVSDLEDELSDYVTHYDLGCALDDYVSSGDLDDAVEDRLADYDLDEINDQISGLDDNVWDLVTRFENLDACTDVMSEDIQNLKSRLAMVEVLGILESVKA